MIKQLIIVESPTKAKTIAKFIGKDFEVLSSFGHIRDLPKNDTGVDVEHNFKPTYVVPTEKKKRVTELKAAAKRADDVILATDEDREGEAIAWHIAEVLKLNPKTAKRITFHEITKSAIEHAVANPRTLDMRLVGAQQARRILDRLVGYELSPVLWQTVRRGLSAGRVQSVALRLIVERERERLAFTQEEYWTIDAVFEKGSERFPAKLAILDGKKLDKLSINSKEAADHAVASLSGATYTVSSIEKKEIIKSPPTPFMTSALQIESNNKLGYGAKETMAIAQSLYETGYITYMRTDSVNLAEAFLTEVQKFVKEHMGGAYATGAKRYKTKDKSAQEAHEAIRPTDVHASPNALKTALDDRQWRLYDLIWSRTIASQLPPAKLERTSIDLKTNESIFRATGNAIVFDGFMKVYRAAQEKMLPVLTEGDAVDLKEIIPNQHFTEPPARYSDASLVKTMEEFGIGRPSTYAPTIGTIVDRGYVERDDQKKLFPTDTGMTVTDILVKHFPNIVDYHFTATMEKGLDDIADGTVKWAPILKEFYEPFHKTISEKTKEIRAELAAKVRVVGTDPATGLPVIAKGGRYGPYVQLGEWSAEDQKAKINKPKSASIGKDDTIESITIEKALGLLAMPRLLGVIDGKELTANLGRFGPYVKLGEVSVSLPPTLSPITITQAEAEALIKVAAERKKAALIPIAELGIDPASGKPVLVKTGRYGPYVTDGITNVSAKKSQDPAAITHDEAVAMLEKKRAMPKRVWKKKMPNA